VEEEGEGIGKHRVIGGKLIPCIELSQRGGIEKKKNSDENKQNEFTLEQLQRRCKCSMLFFFLFFT